MRRTSKLVVGLLVGCAVLLGWFVSGWWVLALSAVIAVSVLLVAAFGLIAQSEMARVAPFQNDVPSALPDQRSRRQRRLTWAVALVGFVAVPALVASERGLLAAAGAVAVSAVFVASFFLVGRSTGSHLAAPLGERKKPREKPWF